MQDCLFSLFRIKNWGHNYRLNKFFNNLLASILHIQENVNIIIFIADGSMDVDKKKLW
jgi:hypothetical protein